MSYLDSKYVAIYPSANRKNGYNPEARLNTEENLTGILNHLTDKDSFVIDYSSSSGKIRFVLAGYYFECILSELGSNPVYAQIRLKSDLESVTESSEEGKQYNNKRLVSCDDESDNLDNSSNKFVGLNITTTEPTDSTEMTPYIQLLNSFSDGTIPEESKLKLTTTSIGDAGELEESIDTHFTTKGLKVNGNATITGDTSIDGGTTIGQKLNVNKIESSSNLEINCDTASNDIKLLNGITIKNVNQGNSNYLFITTSNNGCFELTKGIYFPFNYSKSTQKDIIDYILDNSEPKGTKFVYSGLTIVLEKVDIRQFTYIKTCLQSLSTTGICSLRMGRNSTTSKYFIYAQTVDNELWYCPDTETPVWTDLGKITALTSTTSQLNLNTTR